ncbi:MAG: succinate dehydrogenase assembly factor 2 [Hyphomonadaceae bacterium]
MPDDVRRRKLRFRASRRGIRELDLFMEAFADARMDSMSDQELDEFERLLDIPDQDVYAWILGRESPPPELRSGVLSQILDFEFPPFR